MNKNGILLEHRAPTRTLQRNLHSTQKPSSLDSSSLSLSLASNSLSLSVCSKETYRLESRTSGPLFRLLLSLTSCSKSKEKNRLYVREVYGGYIGAYVIYRVVEVKSARFFIWFFFSACAFGFHNITFLKRERERRKGKREKRKVTFYYFF